MTFKLSIDVAGNTSGTEHDQVVVGGSFTVVVGDLELNTPTGGDAYTPETGDRFTFLVANGGIEGRFSSFSAESPDWGIRYNDTSAVLEFLDPSGRGDYNGNGQIEQADLDLVLRSWGGEAFPVAWTEYLPAGGIDQAELDALLLGWGRVVGGNASTSLITAESTIPEPASWLLGSLGVLIVGIASATSRADKVRLPNGESDLDTIFSLSL